MSAGTRGSAAEIRTIREFEKQGYWCVRAAGSHGVADLVALKPRQALLIQVKRTHHPDPEMSDLISGSEFNAVFEAARMSGGTPVLAAWTGGAGPKSARLHLLRITGLHVEYSKFWPVQELVLDELAATA